MKQEIDTLNEDKKKIQRKLRGRNSDSSSDDGNIPDDASKKKSYLTPGAENQRGLPSLFDLSEDDSRNEIDKSVSLQIPEQIEFEHPEIPTMNELFWTFLCMPVILYVGLGRVAVLSERKTSLMQFAQA